MVLNESIPARILTATAWQEFGTRWSFDPANPFAVRVLFGDDPGVPWDLSRELLTDGLRAPAGQCDVRVFPSSLGRALFVQLRSPSGEALFELKAYRVAAFLARCDGLCPAGGTPAALDAALDVLLGRTD